MERIIFILRSGCSFRDSSNSSIKNHYSSIHKKFLLWSKSGLFTELFNDVVNQFGKKFSRKIHKSGILNLFIDTTNIRNKCGRDKLGKNYQDKGKKGNKVSTICTDDKFILGVSVEEANRHDSVFIERTINNIPNINNLSNLTKINLIGDKAYVIKEGRQYKLLKRGIKIVYPKRKNQKKKNTKGENKLLDRRYNIENSYATLKQFKYVQLRYPHKVSSYASFVYLAVIFMNYRILFKKG